MTRTSEDERGYFSTLIGDGRPLLFLTGLILILSGGFAIFQSISGQFLPQDVQYLGMTSGDLCRLNECKIVHFMFHDRVSFGGAIIAVGSLYLWLVEFPLKAKEPWAWWLFVASGTVGFGSFLAYLGYGYLDSWHGTATLLLLPIFVAGLCLTYGDLSRPAAVGCLLRSSFLGHWKSAEGVGRACLLLTAFALMVGGLTIMTVGSTSVFVPQDLEFMGLSSAELHAINPHLVPLIAHDRAGFGGGLACTGLTVFFIVWCARPSRHLWQVIAFAGSVGFITAIGVHPVIGYLSLSHLAPAVVVACIFVAGLILNWRPMVGGEPSPPTDGAAVVQPS